MQRLSRIKDAALGLMLALLGVGLLVSPLPARSVLAAAYIAAGLALCWALGRAVWPLERLRLAKWAALIAALGLSALVVFARFSTLGLARRLAGEFNANVVAGALVILAPFAVARLTLAPALYRPTWWGAVPAGGALLVALPITLSRAAYLAVAVGLVVVVALRWPRAAWGLAALGAAAVTAGAILGWRHAIEVLLRGGAAINLNQRIEIWSRALMLIGDFPITGSGPGCFEPIVARLYPLFSLSKSTVSHAHNLYLQVAVDLGLPGLAAYLTVLGISAYQGLAAHLAFRRTGRRQWAMLAAACLGALAGLALHGLLDCAVWGNKLAFLPWAVMGLCGALARASTARE